MNIPTEKECFELMAEVSLAPAITRHSIAVKNIALEFADRFETTGTKVNKDLLAAAALLHDLLKVDAQVCHGMEAGEFLRKKGYPEVGRVVETHCLNNLSDPSLVPRTPEEKLLMLADLRIISGELVSLDDRFKYIEERYKPKNLERFAGYKLFAEKLQEELLGEKSD